MALGLEAWDLSLGPHVPGALMHQGLVLEWYPFALFSLRSPY